ncbi:hypothetical protein [Geoalkalibacter halelectricus]|uniref:Type II secretory pathway, pseudopilin PulG n=1 Tax=Geoalkalibacter halelectricus TaxID=2847045 RepID=A0ABY5ZIU7_9BACT|nr:hypothetical protein [Geoalkalibacter halelectricus]MDO3378910.1 hypothetical protein [Geoalkalibacter halelectricus]UWZ79067.1 hypothetical protein L9S41_15480 [Geoalkalibacter halelectricus]
MSTSQSRLGFLRPLQNQRGAMLMVAIIAVVVMGLGSAMAGMSWKAASQRAKEQDLLWVGRQYLQAIESYYHTDLGGRVRQPGTETGTQQRRTPGLLPNTVEDLLRDPRAAQVVRHLRKPYKDPMTGEDFVLLRDTGGRIRGVRSSSTLVPFQTDNFPPGLERLAGAETYAQWEFAFDPTAAGRAGGVTLDGQVPGLDPGAPGLPGTPGGPGGPGIGVPTVPGEPSTPGRPSVRPRPGSCVDPTPCPPDETCIFDPDKCAFVPYTPSWIHQQMFLAPGSSPEYGR